MDRLSVEQSERLASWLPGVSVVADLSWGLTDTAVLQVRTGERELVVKAFGRDDDHIAPELRAHREFTAPWTNGKVAERRYLSEESFARFTPPAPTTLPASAQEVTNAPIELTA